MRCEPHLKCTLKCALDSSCFEMNVYIELLKNSPIGVDKLAEILDKDKSTVYKALQNLLEKGYVTRDCRILRGGGYKYLYKPVPFGEFKKKVLKNIEEWVRQLTKYLEELEEMSRTKLLEVLESEKV
ncbi:MAG TPA: winged helix-turn-helix transcriptional regulator [Archaeoglobus sp.]|nr:winged helix-turn-helix transcriptional regulator [Archaeoglobus sp.]